MLQIMGNRLEIVKDAWNAVQRCCDNFCQSIRTHRSSASFCDLDFSVIELCLQPASLVVWPALWRPGRRRKAYLRKQGDRSVHSCTGAHKLPGIAPVEQIESAQWYQGTNIKV